MSNASLTAKYRPQTFGQLAGQETIKTILSRASLEQKVAPAYLFSGTRGVGKTTIARIFAKALNCRNAPTAEPCNECDQCKAITAGSAVDVVEIDGASNRGIDDVRRLKEVVGYAPMEGGYKIFIIDEAHMLSREAFNALLKTLEEPPARVTFIMATTEPHKFPATIISRCQHYVFKPLSEAGLVEHLSGVLQTEGVAFDPAALRLIARRGAGSVRDSMSLLGQVLALGDGKLTEDSARNVLGLAGQEAFLDLLQACKNGDSLAIARLLKEMLHQGLDIGFFLRELAALWRNLFMLRQSGEGALAVVDIPENEARRYLEIAQDFSLQYIHACWQMTLEGQRRVLTSLEPALALELLLLNIGMLPQILSLEKISALNRKAGGGHQGNALSPAARSQGSTTAAIERQAPATRQDDSREASAFSKVGEAPQQFSEPAKAEKPQSFAPEAASPQNSTLEAAEPQYPTPETAKSQYSAPKAEIFPEKSESAASVEQTQTVFAEKQPDDVEGSPSDEYDEGMAQSILQEFGPSEIGLEYFQGSEPEKSSHAPKKAAFAEESGSDPGVFANDTPADFSDTAKQEGEGATSAFPAKEDIQTNAPLAFGKKEIQDEIPSAFAKEDSSSAISFRQPDWDSIFPLCESLESPPWMVSLLRRLNVAWQGEKLTLEAHDEFALRRLNDPAMREQFEQLLKKWCGVVPEMEFSAKIVQRKTRDDIKAELQQHPLVKEIEDTFGGYVIDYGQIRS